MRATVPYSVNMAHCAGCSRLAVAVAVAVTLMESKDGEFDSVLKGDGKSASKLIS